MVINNMKATPKEKNVKTAKVVKTSTAANTSSLDNKEKTIEEEVKRPNRRADGALIGNKSRFQTPPFLLSFEIFNRNVHNCLVDLGASSNLMPYSVYKKLNSQPKMCRKKIIQLDRSHVKVMRELKDVMIRLSSNSKVHQVIDVIVVDIPEDYGVILSRDWSCKLNGYFATDWSHLWLPFKGQLNKIKVDREQYMKHIVTYLNDTNEPVMFSHSILGNFFFKKFFGELEEETSTCADSNEESELLQITQTDEPHYTIVENCTNVDTNNSSDIVPIPCDFALELTDPNIWNLIVPGTRKEQVLIVSSSTHMAIRR